MRKYVFVWNTSFIKKSWRIGVYAKIFGQTKSGFKTLWKTGERKLPNQFFLSKRGGCFFEVGRVFCSYSDFSLDRNDVSDHLNGEDLLIAYGNLPIEGLFREEVYFLEENLLHANSKLRIRVVPCPHWKLFVYSERYSTYSEQRDHTMMCQVVVYKTFKQSGQKVFTVAYEWWSLTRGSHYRALTGKILVFCSGGRLREVFVRLPFVSDQDRL